MSGGFLLSLPITVLAGIHNPQKPYMNRTVLTSVCEVHEKYVHTVYVNIYNISNQVIISICLLAMVTLNIMTVKRLLNSKMKLNSLKKQRLAVSLKTEDKLPDENKDAFEAGYAEITSASVRDSELPNDANQCHATKQCSVSGEECHGDISSTKPNTRKINKLRREDAQMKPHPSGKIRHKTKIMLVLTAIFTTTVVLYMTMVHFRSNRELDKLPDSRKTVFVFFFRFVFVNHVINPFVYGCLDRKFQHVVKKNVY